MIPLRNEKLRIGYITMLVDACQEKLAYRSLPKIIPAIFGHGEATPQRA
jgi:hypothetical protein